MNDELITISVKIFKSQYLKLREDRVNISALVRKLLSEREKGNSNPDQALMILKSMRLEFDSFTQDFSKRLDEFEEKFIKQKEQYDKEREETLTELIKKQFEGVTMQPEFIQKNLEIFSQKNRISYAEAEQLFKKAFPEMEEV